jgi:uncharacterized BrkB/YihY/UPF0761 family membrane protein
MIHDLTLFTESLILGYWTFLLGIAIIIITVMLVFKWIPKWKKQLDDKVDDIWK